MEEVKELCDGLELENEDVYMATTFKDFVQLLVRKLRGDDRESECVIDYVSSGLLHVGSRMVQGGNLDVQEAEPPRAHLSVSQALCGSSG